MLMTNLNRDSLTSSLRKHLILSKANWKREAGLRNVNSVARTHGFQHVLRTVQMINDILARGRHFVNVEVEDKVGDKPHDHVSDEAHGQVGDEQHDQVGGEQHDQVCDEQHDKVGDEKHDQVGDEQHDQVGDEQHDQVGNGTHDQVGDEQHGLCIIVMYWRCCDYFVF